MKKWICILSVFVIPFVIFAQDNPSKNASELTSEDKVYSYVEQLPSFQGGTDSLHAFIKKTLVYPVDAKHNKIEGRVIVGFVVEKTGVLRDFQIKRGLSKSCDQAVIDMMIKMPRWISGSQNGKPVNVNYTLPVYFKL